MRSGQHKIKCFGFILFIATWCNEGWSTKSQIFRLCFVYIGIYKISCNICAKKFLLESYNPSNLIFLKIFIERSYFILNITKGAYLKLFKFDRNMKALRISPRGAKEDEN